MLDGFWPERFLGEGGLQITALEAVDRPGDTVMHWVIGKRLFVEIPSQKQNAGFLFLFFLTSKVKVSF